MQNEIPIEIHYKMMLKYGECCDPCLHVVPPPCTEQMLQFI